MRSLQTRRDRSPFFFDSFFEDFDRLFTSAADARSQWLADARTAPGFVPTYELSENERGYLLSFDLPGIPKDDIRIEIKDQHLRVWGERKFEETREQSGRSYSERRYGKFERVFQLPKGVDLDKVQAHHENGVLQLMIPKVEKTEARAIKIESGSPGFFSKLINRRDEEKSKTAEDKVQ